MNTYISYRIVHVRTGQVVDLFDDPMGCEIMERITAALNGAEGEDCRPEIKCVIHGWTECSSPDGSCLACVNDGLMDALEQVYPSFTAQMGREPVAGVDYDPDGGMCQDDYEYLTGTGRYSDDLPVSLALSAYEKYERGMYGTGWWVDLQWWWWNTRLGKWIINRRIQPKRVLKIAITLGNSHITFHFRWLAVWVLANIKGYQMGIGVGTGESPV